MAFRGRGKFNRRFVRNRKRVGTMMKKRYGGARRARAIGNPRQKVWYFSRHCELTSVPAGADGTDALVTRTFTLVDLPAPTDFTNLFDWYKINYVVVKMLPFFSEVNMTGVTSGVFSVNSSPANLRIFTCIDYNDGTAPASINEIREYKNCKVTPYIRGQTRKFKPRPTLVSDDATPDVQYPIGNPWISTDSTGDDCVHFGLKIGIDTSLLPADRIAASDILLRIECIYYISCKGAK